MTETRHAPAANGIFNECGCLLTIKEKQCLKYPKGMQLIIVYRSKIYGSRSSTTFFVFY